MTTGIMENRKNHMKMLEQLTMDRIDVGDIRSSYSGDFKLYDVAGGEVCQRILQDEEYGQGGRAYMPQDSVFPRHAHYPDGAEVFFVFWGHIVVRTGDEDRHLVSGDMIIIPPGQEHVVLAVTSAEIGFAIIPKGEGVA